MAICGDGGLIGTIGGGAGEGKVVTQALAVLNAKDRTRGKASKGNKTDIRQLIEIDLTGTPNRETQGICGGKVQVWLEVWHKEWAIALVEQILKSLAAGKSVRLVTPLERKQASHPSIHIVDEDVPDANSTEYFVETLQPPPVLFIVGGGHVAIALAHMAGFAGFQIAVQDDRLDFITPERFPQARFLSTSISEALDSFTAHSQLYVALVARGFQQDVEALQTLLQQPLAYRYVGAIGSQKRIHRVCQAMRQKGIPVERLPNFHSPIGLDIGALTPQEIAVSICAELIKVRRGGTGLSLCERIQQPRSTSKVHVGERLYANLL